MEEKPIRYVLYTTSLKGLQDTCKLSMSSNSYQVTLYKHTVDRSDLSEAQKEIQRNNKWATDLGTSIYMSTDDIVKLIEKDVYSKLQNLNGEKVYDKIYEDTFNAPIMITASLRPRAGYTRVEINTELEKEEDKYIYSYDTKEFEEKLKGVSKSAFGADEEVMVEELSISISTYRYNNTDDRVAQLVKKFIRDNLTYCMKNGALIVPEEYLQRGKEGIEEWREKKRSSNKNNSIEKKLLREVIAAKKRFTAKTMDAIMYKIVAQNSDWSLPVIEIDGRFNKQKTNKLVAKVLKDVSPQELIEISEDEVITKIKEYWKERLMDAYNAVDNAVIEKEIN